MEKICSTKLSTKEVQKSGLFSGYASVFNVSDHQNDVILAGAFAETMACDVKLLWQHNKNEPIGNILDIVEDQHGLYIKAQLLLELSRAKEAYIMLKSGMINALSIGYNLIDFEIDHKNNTKFIKKVKLWEISLVTFPANEEAQVTAIKNRSSLTNSQKITTAIIRAEKAIIDLSCPHK